MNLKKRFRRFVERWTLRLIIITPLAALAILTAVITSFYIDKMNFYFKENAARYLDEYIAGEKRQGEIFVEDINLLAKYTVDHLAEKSKKELDERLELPYKAAKSIYNKYDNKLSENAIKERILDALSAMTWHGEKDYVFVTDYDGNNILSASKDLIGKNLSSWSDADGRAIVLEEIQMVRKHGEGYIETRLRDESGLQTIKVKDFGHYKWFFGSGIHKKRVLDEEKKELLDLIERAPKDRSGYIAIFENNRPLFISEEDQTELSSPMLTKMQEHLVDKNGWVELPQENAHIYIRYFEPFKWHLVYGFKKAYLDAMLQDQQKKMKENFDKEVEFVVAVSIFIALLVGILTFIVSRRIITIIKAYKQELDVQENTLRELNSSLEERVNEEVAAHREKEKMLIQQSKMAAMGDMISMIAHQWRQPLNQMSYILMNIDSAYEFNELTPKYMDEKVKEGTRLLEYMSHTIDDFKNFFKPDKERSDEQISEVVKHTISLVEKSLDAHKIELEMKIESDTRLMVYRNELLQVILNLITNAKDALVLGEVNKPKITISLTEDDESITISVCDNGGGVDIAIQEKIFEPYFSTKGEKSGTGLGLYMAKTIVEGHLNGELSVVNSDKGACFTVMLRK
ncbi:MAG: cache domain-containing protein [Helicobacteraceae bacterium]|jgi:signal transduction histidine kinase|nr:cache domain-containing protein [Helicobacteraceae bacterium]